MKNLFNVSHERRGPEYLDGAQVKRIHSFWFGCGRYNWNISIGWGWGNFYMSQSYYNSEWLN